MDKGRDAMTAVERIAADDGRARSVPSTLWQVDTADGQVVYQSPDLELANDIYGGSTGRHHFRTGTPFGPAGEV
jgi:hypothetical protein